MMQPIEFSIRYSEVGGYEDQALAFARRLFADGLAINSNPLQRISGEFRSLCSGGAGG